MAEEIFRSCADIFCGTEKALLVFWELLKCVFGNRWENAWCERSFFCALLTWKGWKSKAGSHCHWLSHVEWATPMSSRSYCFEGPRGWGSIYTLAAYSHPPFVFGISCGAMIVGQIEGMTQPPTTGWSGLPKRLNRDLLPIVCLAPPPFPVVPICIFSWKHQGFLQRQTKSQSLIFLNPQDSSEFPGNVLSGIWLVIFAAKNSLYVWEVKHGLDFQVWFQLRSSRWWVQLKDM